MEYQRHLHDYLGTKDTGNPLSVIPKYTINNSGLDDYRAFSASVNWTLYGRQNRVPMRSRAAKIPAACRVKSWGLFAGGNQL